MSWLFSQALVEEFSEDISLDGEPCALWNGTPTQPPSWCSDRTMAACRLSRSGMTFRPLTDDLGEAVLMSFLEAFPAQTSPVLEKERESRERDPVCGDTWQELLVKYDPNSSSWKTHRCLWEEDLPEYSVTLPRWGMMLGGELWERITLPPLISGTGSGLWRTPASRDYKGAADPEKRIASGKQVGLNDQVKHPSCKNMWPTPTASEDAAGTPKGKMQAMLGNHPNIRGTNQKDWACGSLNPTWVEAYLMNWPVAWTSMEPLPKEVFREWERGFLTGSIDSSALETDKSLSVQP